MKASQKRRKINHSVAGLSAGVSWGIGHVTSKKSIPGLQPHDLAMLGVKKWIFFLKNLHENKVV